MSILPKAISRLIESFQRLPGIGPKTAQRLAFYLLHVPDSELELFAESISGLKKHTVLCSLCKNAADKDPCEICSNPSRDNQTICVVEQPTDVLAIEKTGRYNGLYHVLHGVIDPLNNIGPDEIYIGDLMKRIINPPKSVKELILALNPNMEGEATALYIQKLLFSQSKANKLAITRIAHGLPVGADIEYADEVTLMRALENRRTY